MSEVRIGVLGNVDSGKSTIISVLSFGDLDNGRGQARQKVLKHKHESDTGRTSSLSHTFLNTNNSLISFVDMAGHEKYLKTTIYGINGFSIDYIMLLIGSNMGVLKMTKEHLALILSLKLPIFIVLTKVDICPENVLNETLNNITKILKRPGIKKNPILISNPIGVESLNFKNDVPIFQVSNTTGFNIPLLKNFIAGFKPNPKWITLLDKNKRIVVESTYMVSGIGLVLSGVVTSGVVSVGDKMLIGPFNGVYREIIIKSIHDNFSTNVNQIESGNSGYYNVKCLDKKYGLKRNQIKKGMVIIDNKFTQKKCHLEFSAEIQILHHPTTIKINYEPVIHCGSVSQTAKICEMDNPLLRTGDKAIVKFRFKRHPEYIEKNTKLIFREGKTKGVGIVTELY